MSQQIGTHEWDFGDGETSDEVDPSHLYKRPGTYTVTLTVDNACGTDVSTQEVTVRYNGIDIFNGGAPPSPNPTPGVVTVEYVGQPADVITINVVGLDGQYSEVFKGDFTSGQMKETLDLSFLNEGSYFLFFQTKNDVSMTKVIIQK
jgi:PKD repeat protein